MLKYIHLNSDSVKILVIMLFDLIAALGTVDHNFFVKTGKL